MERLSEIYRNFIGMFSGFWGRTSNVQKIAGGILTVLVLVSIGSLFFLKESKSFNYLYTNLPPEDVTAISNFLAKNSMTDYQIDDKGISVPSEKIDQIRIMLSQEGLPD